VSIFGGGFVLLGLVWVSGCLIRSPYVTEARVPRDQPVPFSHKHHAGDLGIDCRYCHTPVETSSFAGIPPFQTCMNCHDQVWTDSEVLAPIRRSARDEPPLRWARVHRLPDYVYFDHSIHLAKGVGCISCHGHVEEMPLIARKASLYMEWCVDCHRHPEAALRPRDRLFDVTWDAARDDQGERRKEEFQVRKRTDCVDCHR